MLPEERARIKIDNQLVNAGWDVVSRHEYIPNSASAVKEALMQGNTESDYLLFVEDKAIAVVEAKKESDPLGKEVEKQAERYAVHPQSFSGYFNLSSAIFTTTNKLLQDGRIYTFLSYDNIEKIQENGTYLSVAGENM